MSLKTQMTLASAVAVVLSTGALWPLFGDSDWLSPVLGGVLVVMAVGLAVRRIAVPSLLQPLLTTLGLVAYVAVVYASGTLDHGLLPTGRTLDAFRDLISAGQGDIQEYAPPVPTTEGLVLLTTLGVGAVAVVVDLIAVVMRRAAVAGVPLLALYAIPSAVLPGGLGGLPFVLGAIGWMGLLLVEGGERVSRWGAPMGGRATTDESSLGRVGRRIGVTAVSAAVIVPLLIPGLDGRLLGGNGAGGTGTGSGSNSAKTYNPIVRLGEQLSLPEPKELLQYTTTDPQPDYLRMTTLDTWNGSGWQASELTASQKDDRVQDGIDVPIGDGGAHRDLTMRIKITKNALDVYWLPVPFGPRKIKVDGLWLWESDSQTVFSAQRSTGGLPAYDVSASRPLPDRDALAAAQVDGIPAQIRDHYGTPIRVAPYVTTLTRQVVNGKASEYDKAVAIQAYFTSFRNNFVYDLTPSQPTRDQDPLEAFLYGKHGFCEQYATAMAAMLRVAGIPSRVAVGFTPGSLLPKDPKNPDAPPVFSVTTSEAHAWPEAWFAGTGWVRFEPTPSLSGAVAPDYTSAAAVTPGQEVPQRPTTTPPTVAPNNNLDRVRDPDLRDRPTGVGGPTGTTASPNRRPWVVVPIALAVLAVLPPLLTLLRRRRRWQHPGPLTAWEQVRDDAVDVGHRWHESDSPRAAAQHLLAARPLRPAAVTALEVLALAAEQHRYAPADRRRTVDLRPEVAAVRAGLQDTASTSTRLRVRYAPPSTLRWAGTTVADTLARTLNRFDDGVAALTRPLRRVAAR